MKNDIILKAENISKSFPGVQALSNACFEARRGHVHALCGENGAGKSTLLKIVTGLYVKDSGDIYLEGNRVEINSVETAGKLGIYVVPQEIQMLKNLSVAENIFLGRPPLKKAGIIDWKKMYAKAEETKLRLGVHAQDFNVKMKVGLLGMGTWQMIEIMRALANDNVKVLAFDEPTSSLSDSEAETLFKLIEELKAQGVAIIYVSHRLREIFRICDEVSVFKEGKYIATKNIAETTQDELVSLMVGRDIDLFGEKKDASAIKDEIVLKAENFSCGREYRNVSLELKKGEILGLYGLIGAGRTEFARGLFGVDKKDSGELYIKGNKVSVRNTRDAGRHGMGFVTENRREEGLMLNTSLAWNMSMPNLKAIMNRLRFLSMKKEKKYAEEGMRLFSVKASGIDMEAGGLSGGNQQKVVLAKWVKADCDILIVDEPTRGIDIGAKAEVYAALKRLATEGKAIIMISSELPEILGVSDRIIVMCEGKVTADLTNNDLTEDDVIKYAFSS